MEALARSHKHLGDNATILFDYGLPHSIENIVKEQGKEAGGPWECYRAWDYYGWEAERVVAVTDGDHIMELITRARTHLSVILVEENNNDYANTKEYFQQAVGLGLVQKVI